MELQTKQLTPEAILIHINGRFDAAVVEQVKRLWIENEEVHFVITDLSETTFIDSIGLATLVSGLKTTRQRGGELILLKPTEPVKVILELTRMNIVFKIAPTLEEAQAFLKPL
ncbi:MAG: STAS domain-containing protein [Chloroflexi bacterium]|nr:STAS domain-containing protein [Chloroflexota bacterium]